MKTPLQIDKVPKQLFGFHQSFVNFPANSIQGGDVGQTQLWLNQLDIVPGCLCHLSKERFGTVVVNFQLSIKKPSIEYPLDPYKLTIKRHCINHYKDFNFWPTGQNKGLDFSDRQKLDCLAMTIAKDFIYLSHLRINNVHPEKIRQLRTNIALCIRGAFYGLLASLLAEEPDEILSHLAYDLLCEFKKYQRQTQQNKDDQNDYYLIADNLVGFFRMILDKDKDLINLDKITELLPTKAKGVDKPTMLV